VPVHFGLGRSRCGGLNYVSKVDGKSPFGLVAGSGGWSRDGWGWCRSSAVGGLGWLRCRDDLFLGLWMAQAESVAAADIDQAAIFVGRFLSADNVRSDGENDLYLLASDIFLAKEVFQNGKSGEPRIAAEGAGLLIFENAADQADFTVFQAGFMLDATLTDGGLGNAANGLGTGNRGNLEDHFESDFVVGVDVRSDVYVDANVDILKLGVDQWADATTADGSGGIRTSGDGDAVADF
jgi:hypothetical protein